MTYLLQEGVQKFTFSYIHTAKRVRGESGESGGGREKEKGRGKGGEIVIGREGAERGGKLMGEMREKGGEGQRGPEPTLSGALLVTRLHLWKVPEPPQTVHYHHW